MAATTRGGMQTGQQQQAFLEKEEILHGTQSVLPADLPRGSSDKYLPDNARKTLSSCMLFSTHCTACWKLFKFASSLCNW